MAFPSYETMPKHSLSEVELTDGAELVAMIALGRGCTFDAETLVIGYGEAATRDPVYMASARELVSEIRARRELPLRQRKVHASLKPHFVKLEESCEMILAGGRMKAPP